MIGSSGVDRSRNSGRQAVNRSIEMLQLILRSAVLALVLLLTLMVGTANAQDPAEGATSDESQENVLEQLQVKMTAGIGDKAALDKITNRRVTSEVLIPDAGIEAKHFSFISAAGVMYESLSIEGYGDFRQGFHGDLAWSHDPINGPAILSGAMKDQLRRGSRLFTPLHFMTDYASATAAGEEMVGEVDCNIFIFHTKTDTEEKYWISKDASRVIQVTLTADSPMGKIPMSMQLTDYKQVEQIWYAHTMDIQQGTQKMQMIIQDVQHDVEPKEDELTIPAQVQELVDRKKAGKVEGEKKEEEAKEPAPEKEDSER